MKQENKNMTAFILACVALGLSIVSLFAVLIKNNII